MDNLDEIPINATWAIPPTRREELLHELEGLLCGGAAVVGRSAGGSEG